MKVNACRRFSPNKRPSARLLASVEKWPRLTRRHGACDRRSLRRFLVKGRKQIDSEAAEITILGRLWDHSADSVGTKTPSLAHTRSCTVVPVACRRIVSFSRNSSAR